MKKLLLSFLMLVAIISVNAQSVSVPSSGFVYTQDFNTLPTTGTTKILPNGWYIYQKPGTRYEDTIQVTAGSATSSSFYSCGTGTNTDRALGSLISNASVPMYYGVKYVNNTGATITTAQISYKLEQWRRGNNSANHPDSLIVEYNIGSDSIYKGTWITANGLLGLSINTSATVGALDGNAISQTISTTKTGLNIPNGSTFWLRFNDVNIYGNDDILAIDDVSTTFTTGTLPTCVAPTANATNLVLTPSSNSINGSFTASASATKYLVVRSGASTLSATPTNGTAYTAGSAFGGGIVVQSNGATSFTASSLNSATQYYFYVFALNDGCIGEPFYNTTALTGNTTTTAAACGEPNDATNLSFLSVTKNSITGRFTKSIPAAAGYVVVFSKSTNIGYPNDSTTYSVGDSIINGTFKSKIAYIGTDSNFTINGLDSSTRYYIAVVPYANCPGFINYNRTTPLRDDTTTLGSLIVGCFAPDTIIGGVTVGTITNTSIAGSVTAAVNASGYVVVYSKKSFLIAPTDSITYTVGQLITKVSGTFIDSSYIGYVGASPNFNITGLSPGTKYYFAVIPYASCSYGPNYNIKIANSNKNSATTLGGTPSCNAPDTIIGGVTVGTLTTSSIAGSVTAAVNASGYVVVYSKKTFLIAPTDSITYTVGQLITKVSGTFIDSSYIGYVGSSPNFTITGLSPNTKYYFAVIPYASCSYGPNYNIKIANSNKNSATTLLTTGIRTNTNQIAIKLYPNPTTNILNVEFEKYSIGNTNVTIFDNVGRNVYSNSYNVNNQLQINLPDLAKGLYIINLENKDFKSVKTFIVE